MRELYQTGKRKEAAAAVSDELIDAIAICGPPAQCQEKLAEWRSEGLGCAILNLPTNTPTEMVEHFLRTMAPGN